MLGQVSIKYFNACSSGKLAVVASFLDAGVSPQARDRYGLTGLIWAGRKGQVEVADLLIGRGAAVDAVDHRRRTALFHAVTYRRYVFVEHLAELGADLSPIDMHGWTPLDFAETSHHSKMVAILTRLGGISARRRA